MIRVKDSMSGECPMCGSAEIDYGVLTPDADSVYYPAKCDDCGQEFREYHFLVFDAHYIEEAKYE